MPEIDKETQLMEQLVQQRPVLGLRHTFNVELLFAIPSYIMPVVMMALAMVFAWLNLEEISGWAMGLTLGAYLGLFFSAIGAWIYADWRKAHKSGNKTRIKANLKFMQENSSVVKGAYEHTLLVQDAPILDASAPVQQLIDDVLPDIKNAGFKAIMANIESRLPKLEDGKSYKVVRWRFPDTPFPDLKQHSRVWQKGGKGTPINSSLLMVVHEDHLKPNEAFDFSYDKVSTFYANYESEESSYLGELCLWEFYEPLQEWVATIGMGPEHRHTLQQVRPDDQVREYSTIVEFLRMIPALGGSTIRIDALIEAVQNLVREMQSQRAISLGLEGLTPGYTKNSLWDSLRPHKWLLFFITIAILGIIVFSIVTWLGGGLPG